MENRICKKCQLEKPLASFPKRSGRSAHLREHTCGVCKTKRHRAIDPERCRQQRQSERIRRSARHKGMTTEEYLARPKPPQKESRLRIDGLVVRKSRRRRCPVLSSNPKTFYRINADYYKAKSREWGRNNPDKALAKKQRRRVRIAGVKSTLTLTQWNAIKAAFGFRCAYCRLSKPLTQDHITPISKGGDHTVHNVVPACQRCNASKHAGPPPTVVQPLLLTFDGS